MDKTINPADGASDNVARFYDWLEPEYDMMTGFAQRFFREEPFFRLVIEQHGVRIAIDAGCGTGFHTPLLARLGVDMIAADVSRDMLAALSRHAVEMNMAFKPSNRHSRISPGRSLCR